MKKFAAALMAASFLGFAGSAQAAEEGKLLIWWLADKPLAGVEEVGKKFEAELGIPVTVEGLPSDGGTDRFEQAVAAGKGPDIIMWAHDVMGRWVASGLLEPVDPSAEVKDRFADVGWEAFTAGGHVWGYPVSVEAVSLIYNKDLVPEAPKSFDDVLALKGKLPEGTHAIITPTSQGTYFNWGIFGANGAKVFERDASGNLDPSTSSINSAGAVQGGEVLKKLVDEGLMPAGADYGVMDSAFASGKAAMIINGPWSWSNYKDVNFAVAPIPAVGSELGRPFVGVQGAMLSTASPNKDLAREFLENYLLTADGLRTVNAVAPIGVPANKEFAAELGVDEKLAATMVNAERGTPMPNIPEIGRFWDPMHAAIDNIVNGRQTVQEALDTAAKAVTGQQ